MTPTIIIGLGGLGCAVAGRLSQHLEESQRHVVSIVCMDTDPASRQAAEAAGIRFIPLYTHRRERLARGQFPDWFPPQAVTLYRSNATGSGQIRTVARLDALDTEQAGGFVCLDQEIHRLLSSAPGPGRRLNLVVTGSLAGGTGSGLFLQLPGLIRERFPHEQISSRGFFARADLMEHLQPSQLARDTTQVNDYASLLELNALYWAQTRPELKNILQLEHWDGIAPYDRFYLFERDRSGIIPEPSVAADQLACAIFTAMISPLRAVLLPSDEPPIAMIPPVDGMHRYCGLGICRLVYPRELVVDYVTASIGQEIIEEELLIDREVAAECKAQRSRRDEERPVEAFDPTSSFIDFFTDATMSTMPLSHLSGEAFLDRGITRTSRSALLLERVEANLDQILHPCLQNPPLPDIRVNAAVLTTSDAVRYVLQRLRSDWAQWRHLEDKYVREGSRFLADRLLPLSDESQSPEQAECSFRSLLTAARPVSARFLCYDMILRLRARLTELEEKTAQIRARMQELESGNELQSVEAELSRPLFPMHRRRIAEMVRQIAQDSSALYRELILTEILLESYRLILPRLSDLADTYSLFHQRLDRLAADNDRRMREMEQASPLPGRIDLYSGPDALRKAANDCRTIIHDPVSPEIRSLACKHLWATAMERSSFPDFSTAQAEEDRCRRTEQIDRLLAESLPNAFRAAIFDQCRPALDLNARTALLNQLQLEPQVPPQGTPQFVQTAAIYAQQQVQSAVDRATPPLTLEDPTLINHQNTICVAMHPSNAVQTAGGPNLAATRQMYCPNVITATGHHIPDIHVDEGIPDTEIICLQKTAPLRIEDLTQCQPDGSLDLLYRRFIAFSTNPESDIANPHLDPGWSAEGVLPPLIP